MCAARQQRVSALERTSSVPSSTSSCSHKMIIIVWLIMNAFISEQTNASPTVYTFCEILWRIRSDCSMQHHCRECQITKAATQSFFYYYLLVLFLIFFFYCFYLFRQMCLAGAWQLPWLRCILRINKMLQQLLTKRHAHMRTTDYKNSSYKYIKNYLFLFTKRFS